MIAIVGTSSEALCYPLTLLVNTLIVIAENT